MRVNDANLEVAFRGFKTVYNQAFADAQSQRDTIAMTVTSSTSEENYGWLGQFPAMREWIGARHIKQLESHGFKIRNRKFESTVTVKRDDFSDDRYGVYKPMFSEMGRTAKQHPDTLVYSLLASSFDTDCFDGQNFFDTEHPASQKPGDDQAAAVSNMQAGSGTPWFLIDASKAIKPIIWQEREDYEFQQMTKSDDYNVFMHDEFLYGVRARVNCGFGIWQLAFGSKAELNAENYAAARAAMMDYRGDQDQLLGITPTHLIVPPSLEAKGRVLINADQTESTSNIWRVSAMLIVSAYLG